MNTRAPSLPVVFVGSVLLFGAAIVGYEAVSAESFFWRLWHSPSSMVLFAFASLLFGGLATLLFVLVREVRRANRPEMAGYRQALKTGRPSGDVSQWPDWIRHDRGVNRWWAAGAVWAFLWAAVEVLNGSWALVAPMFFAGVYCVWKFWDTRRRLSRLAA